jgi:hypothetical protein
VASLRLTTREPLEEEGAKFHTRGMGLLYAVTFRRGFQKLSSPTNDSKTDDCLDGNRKLINFTLGGLRQSVFRMHDILEEFYLA